MFVLHVLFKEFEYTIILVIIFHIINSWSNSYYKPINVIFFQSQQSVHMEHQCVLYMARLEPTTTILENQLLFKFLQVAERVSQKMCKSLKLKETEHQMCFNQSRLTLEYVSSKLSSPIFLFLNWHSSGPNIVIWVIHSMQNIEMVIYKKITISNLINYFVAYFLKDIHLYECFSLIRSSHVFKII